MGRAYGKRRSGPRLDQPVAQRIANEMWHKRLMAETHLCLGRMHVDVDLLAIALEKQQRKRIAGVRHEIVIRRGDGMQQQLVANQTAVDEGENRIAIALLDLRTGDKTREAKDAAGWIVRLAPKLGDGFGWRDRRRWQEQLPLAAPQLDQLVESLASE